MNFAEHYGEITSEIMLNGTAPDGNIIFYNWIIVPVLTIFGIVVIQVPLG
ncbi:hypothetical protein SAMN02744775_00325 [Enterobacter sp. CC120223-11]|nr:hypothetical protein SAMN02744775_00325 [Enterobacter sp. CC120223-11]